MPDPLCDSHHNGDNPLPLPDTSDTFRQATNTIGPHLPAPPRDIPAIASDRVISPTAWGGCFLTLAIAHVQGLG